MKPFLLILLIPAMLQAQEKKWYQPLVSKNDIIIYSSQAVAGAADGLHEVLVNHIHTFERYYPNADMNWWNPKLSQRNKEHTLVIFSDGYHVTRTIEHSMNYFSIAVSFSDFKNVPKKQWPLLVGKKMLFSFIVNRLAFNGVYKVWFNDKIERQRAGLDGN